jgi:hypothetical protein
MAAAISGKNTTGALAVPDQHNPPPGYAAPIVCEGIVDIRVPDISTAETRCPTAYAECRARDLTCWRKRKRNSVTGAPYFSAPES